MKNSSFPLAVLIVLPLALACAQMENLTDPAKKEIQPGTRTVELPADAEFSMEDYSMTKEDAVVVSLDGEGFYIRDQAHPLEKADGIISSLMADKTPDEREVYVNGDREISWGGMVNLLKEIRAADIDRAGLVVGTKESPDQHRKLGILRVKLPAGTDSVTDVPIKPNPLVLILTQSADGRVTLNNDSVGLEESMEKLTFIFKERESNGVFREGTNEVEKTVFVKAAKNVPYREVVRLIDRAKGAGAQPVGIQLDDLPEN